MKKKLIKLVSTLIKDVVLEVLDEKKHNIKDGLQWTALMETCYWLQGNVPLNLIYEDRFELLKVSLNEVVIENGLFLEFGVYKGQTINFISNQVKEQEKIKIFGFDSFEGLNEPWIYRDKGGFSDIEGKLPKVNKNVGLIKGYFSDSLPNFIKDYKDPISFLHIDSDLYSSAKTIFKHLKNNITAGTVIVFDEFFNYPGWRNGEFKAWNEFVIEENIKFEYIGFTYQKTKHKKSGNQLAVKVISIR